MVYDYQPLILTFQLALVVTAILFVLGVPLAYWIAFSRSKFKYIVETLVSMPLVLPPTVIGFYLLIIFSPQHALGHFLGSVLGVRVVFSFTGLVIGSVLFSLPFMVNPIKAGLQNFPLSLMEASYVLGKSPWETLRRVILPNIKPALLTGMVMAFAHTIGEFGVVLMIGGNIPGETRLASIAIYNEVEALNYDTAGLYALVLVLISFIVLLVFYYLNRKTVKDLLMIKLRLKREMHTPLGKEWLDVDFKIEKGEFVTLFGESGAGKTTFLRILAGLTQPQEGYVEVDDEVWFDSQKRIDLSIQQRKTGFVFQENTLFPHMTVRKNLEYACGDKNALSSIGEWIVNMGLKGLEDKKPDELSGGQKQRVALIRALVNRPKILLLDEPLSDMDIRARLNLQDEIIKMHQKTRITTILVSHDLSEVFKLSRKVFIIEKGKITRSGSPQEVFVNNDLSGKFKFTGEIIEIHKDGVLNILTLSIGNNVTKVVASDEEILGLSIGSKVIVAAKAFNPLILKT